VPGLESEREQVPYPQQIAYAEALAAAGLTLQDIIALSTTLDEHLDQSGNAYLLLSRSRAGDKWLYGLRVLHYLNCIYTKSDDPGEYFLLHSPYLMAAEKLAKNPPDLYRVTRRIGGELRWLADADDTDTERTVLHLRTSASGALNYYGRSPLIPYLFHLYVDFQQGNHVSKAAAGALVSQKILALMQPDINSRYRQGEDGKQVDTFREDAQAVKRMTTNLTGRSPKRGMGVGFGPNGEQSELEVIGYPHGGKEPSVVDLTVLRDAKYLEWQAGYAGDRVAAALNWDLSLTSLGEIKASLGGAGSLLYTRLLQKRVEAVGPKQDHYENLWNWLLGTILEGAGQGVEALGIEFPDAIASLLEGLSGNPTPASPGTGEGRLRATPEETDETQEP
jgi:hypothetical protein